MIRFFADRERRSDHFFPMKRIVLSLIILCPVILQAEDIKARLGLELRSSAAPRTAKARDTVRTGDRIVAYSQPGQNCHVYVVFSHAGKAWLANPAAVNGMKDYAEAYPNLETGWTVPSGAGPVEVMLIVSGIPLADVASLRTPVSTDAWKKIEKRLRDEELMRDSFGKPVPVAANVRSIGAEAFARTLPMYSGAKLVSARFVLEVQATK
jgi:hypothetical protein